MDLSENDFNSINNIKGLGELLKQLPINLQELVLHLSENNFGEYEDSSWYLGESLKKLPVNLNDLILNLYGNYLGEKEESLKYLGEGL